MQEKVTYALTNQLRNKSKVKGERRTSSRRRRTRRQLSEPRQIEERERKEKEKKRERKIQCARDHFSKIFFFFNLSTHQFVSKHTVCLCIRSFLSLSLSFDVVEVFFVGLLTNYIYIYIYSVFYVFGV